MPKPDFAEFFKSLVRQYGLNTYNTDCAETVLPLFDPALLFFFRHVL